MRRTSARGRKRKLGVARAWPRSTQARVVSLDRHGRSTEPAPTLTVMMWSSLTDLCDQEHANEGGRREQKWEREGPMDSSQRNTSPGNSRRKAWVAQSCGYRGRIQHVNDTAAREIPNIGVPNEHDTKHPGKKPSTECEQEVFRSARHLTPPMEFEHVMQ